MFKRTMSVILAAVSCFLMSQAAFAVNDAGSDLRIAVASDLHYNLPREEISGDIDDPVYFYANRRAAMEDESGFIIDEFLKECAEDDSIDYVLISGDLTDSRSDVRQHEELAAKLRGFEAESGKDVFVINGNHDTGSGEDDYGIDDFKSLYHEFGYDKALVTDDATASYTADLGEKYRLICLDSCNQNASTEDGMTLSRIRWVTKQAEQAKIDGRFPILMMHHNLLDHLPVQRLLSHDFIVRFHHTTAEIFADSGIKIVFSGHEHCSDAAVYTSALGNKLYDFATTSLTMYPLEYRVVTFGDDNIEYESRAVSGIDLDAMTSVVNGFTDEQLRLMGQDINAYSKGFLKAGVQYRLELSLSMEKLGIKESDIYYGVVNNAVSRLISLLRLPLYGENSLAAEAARYGILLPETEYETGWDLATELVAWHYAGEEDLPPDSPAVEALLKAVALILHSTVKETSDYIFKKGSNALLAGLGSDSTDELKSFCLSVFGAVRPGEYFTVALISPLLFEFAVDSDGVNDNHGVIEGFGSMTAADRARNVGSVFIGSFNTIRIYFRYFFYFLIKPFMQFKLK